MRHETCYVGRGMRCSRRNLGAIALPLALGGTLLVPKCAVAAPEAGDPLALHWTAPAGCPGAAAVHDKVLALTGSELRPAEARATTTRDGDGYRVHVVVGSGARDVVAGTCDLAADAAATVIALSLVPELATRSDAAHAANASTDSSAPPPAPRASVAPPPESAHEAPPADRLADADHATIPARPRRALFAAGVFGAVDRGTLPDVGLGAGFEIAFTPGRFRFEAEVAPWLASSASTPPDANGVTEGGTFHLTTAAVRACYAVVDARIALAPCVGLGLDHVSAEGSGVARTREGSSTLVAPGIGVGAALRLTRRFALRALVEGEVPIGREQFVIVGGNAVHRPAAVALRGAIGPEVTF